MSLLMDALKRAEEEKRKAAQEQSAQPDKGTITGPHSLAALAASAEAKESIPLQQRTGSFDTSRLSLEPLAAPPPASGSAATDATPNPLQEGLEDAAFFADEVELDYGSPLSGGSADTTAGAQSAGDNLDLSTLTNELDALDRTTALPGNPFALEADDVIYEQTGRGAFGSGARLEGTASGRRALLQRATGATTAKMMFSAKSRPQRPSVWLPLAGVAAVCLLLFGGGVWWWNKMTAAPTAAMPSASLAAQAEPQRAPLVLPEVQARPEQMAAAAANVNTESLPAVSPQTLPATGLEAPPALPASDAGNVLTPAEAEAGAEAAMAETTAPDRAAADAAPAPPAMPAETAKPTAAADPLAGVDTTVPTPAPATTKPSAPVAAASADRMTLTSLDGDVLPGKLRITSSPARKAVSPQVLEAYQAYQRGEYPRAEQLYRAVLAREPNKRDALLGVAAIAQRKGDRDEAMRRYQQLLALNPQDPLAGAALTALSTVKKPDTGGESSVKLQIQQTPDNPHLYYLLGNQYAKQQRWADAQGAYFEALRRDKDNADFAYNLAVSLDQIGAGKNALEYYRKAQSLAAAHKASFANTDVQARIDSLSAAHEGGGRGQQ